MSTAAFLDTMRRGLTPAYHRGLERVTLTLGATNPATRETPVPAYDFAGYGTRNGGRLPDSPRYLLVPRVAVTDPVTVRVWYERGTGQPEQSTVVALPGGWPAGRGSAIRVPGMAATISNTLRLTRFRPDPPASPAAADWEIVALLGNLAKLLWVVGVEHEELAGHATDVAAQRNAPTAHGASLDLLGQDLCVRRFPPRPYTWDPDTIALYHLDDRPVPPNPEVVTVADDRARYQPTSHPGVHTGGHSGRPGRFGGAFEFGPGPVSGITVPDHPDFVLLAGASFTVEALIKPYGTGTGAVVAKRAQLKTDGAAGWALTVGSFRGINRNVRFSVSDGAGNVDLFADVDLGDGRFHHVAGVVDHRAGPPASTHGELYLDGVRVAARQLDSLGALTSTEPVRIGLGTEQVANDAQFVGLIDEVRLSGVARRSFHPVAGEGDEEYRRRLAVFQRWITPTPDGLRAALDEMAGPVGGDPHPFVVDEGIDPLATGTVAVRVLPSVLPPGGGIAADGDLRTTEAAAVGMVVDEPEFEEAWLRRHEDRAGLDFGGAEEHRQMQVSVRDALGRLLDRLTGVAGKLVIVRAYDPDATDLYRIGRAVTLAHETVPPGELAVHAHAAGFGWVRRLGTGQVHAAQPHGEPFRVTPPAPAARLPDVIEGGTLTLGLDPDPTVYADAKVEWTMARCGAGTATLSAGKKPTLTATAAGDLAVHAEVTRRRHTAGGSRLLRIGLADKSLAVGQSIGRDGTRGVTEAAAAGAPLPDFDELYMVTRTDDYLGIHPNVDYGTDPATRRMQRVTGRALGRLLDLLAGTPGTLSVLAAYDPVGTGLSTQGRALLLRHSGMPGPALAARAFAAGFDFVRVDAPQSVQVAVAPDEQLGLTPAGPAEVRVGGALPVAVDPLTDPAGVAFGPDGSRAYVTSRGSARVTALQLAVTTGTLPDLTVERSTRVPATPAAVAVTAQHVYVAHELPAVVSVLDPVTLAPGTPIPTGPRPVAAAVGGTRLFVACAGNRTLRAYDTGTQQPVGSVVLPDVPRAIAVVPGGTQLYVVIAGDRFCPVDQATLVVGAPVATGTGAGYAVVTPDGKKLYVSCARDRTVRVYATASNTQTAVVAFPGQARPAAVAVDRSFLYVVTPTRVHVVDATTDTLLPQVFSPGSPSTLLATSPGAAAYPPCLLAASGPAATATLADPAPLTAVPARPPRIVTAVGLGSGDGELLAWAPVPVHHGRVALSSLTAPSIQVTGREPGTVLVRASSVHGHHLLPYQFEVRLKAALDADPAVTVTKDQYDLVMNVLNWFHPIGVEVRTDRLRTHVVELGAADADLFPGYTFPSYRNPELTLPGQTAGITP